MLTNKNNGSSNIKIFVKKLPNYCATLNLVTSKTQKKTQIFFASVCTII